MKYVLFHDHCADGFASAFAAWTFLGHEGVRYIAMPNSPRVVPEGIGEGDEVWVLDYSFPRPVLEELKGRVKSLVVIDHHESMREEIADLPYVVFDLDHSGCVLTWMWFMGRPEMGLHEHSEYNLTFGMPEAFHYIEHRDIGKMWREDWNWLLPLGNQGCREIYAGLWQGTARSFEIWAKVIGDHVALAAKGRPLVEMEDSLVSQAVSGLHWVDLPNFRAPAVLCPVLQSEICNRLLKRMTGYPIAVCYFRTKEGRWQYSLRSRHDGVNLVPIVKALGGGGHPQSAGFTLDEPLTVIDRNDGSDCRCSLRGRLVGDGCSVCNPELK